MVRDKGRQAAWAREKRKKLKKEDAETVRLKDKLKNERMRLIQPRLCPVNLLSKEDAEKRRAEVRERVRKSRLKKKQGMQEPRSPSPTHCQHNDSTAMNETITMTLVIDHIGMQEPRSPSPTHCQHSDDSTAMNETITMTLEIDHTAMQEPPSPTHCQHNDDNTTMNEAVTMIPGTDHIENDNLIRESHENSFIERSEKSETLDFLNIVPALYQNPPSPIFSEEDLYTGRAEASGCSKESEQVVPIWDLDGSTSDFDQEMPITVSEAWSSDLVLFGATGSNGMAEAKEQILPDNRSEEEILSSCNDSVQICSTRMGVLDHIITDTEKKERERKRYKRRKEIGKVRPMHVLTPEEQERKRERNRINVKNFRERRKKAEQLKNLPKHGTLVKPRKVERVVSRQKLQGRKRVKRDRAKLLRKIKKLETDNKFLRKRVNALKKQLSRSNNKLEMMKPKTPKQEAREVVRGCKVSTKVEKELTAYIALKRQLAKCYRKFQSRKDKAFLTQIIAGKDSEVRKSRVLQNCKTFVTKTCDTKVSHVRSTKSETLRKAVTAFLESDEASRQAPGKKDFITRNKQKLQKRFLNKTLHELHKIFMNESKIKINFSTFCKYKPFNIITPKAANRETCACIIHENVNELVVVLHKLKVTDFRNAEGLAFSMCCFVTTEACLARECPQCQGKELLLSTGHVNTKDQCRFKEWKHKSEKRISAKTKKTITVQLTVKEEKQASIEEVCNLLQEKMKSFFQHLRRIRHQYKAMKELKNILSPDEIIVHVDFAENYNCKYAKEVQAVHFGASRPQVTLHTGVLYSHGKKPMSFCTLSESLQHDPVAIFAHLEPILSTFLEKNPQVRKLHFQSDGPTTQYKNKKMFGLLSTSFAKKFPQIKIITWNYSESYHGKSAPDGIGAVLKRAADDLVARGYDVDTFQKFFQLLKQQVTGVTLFAVSEKDIEKADEFCFHNELKFKGIKKVHQITWSRGTGNVLFFNEMSCFECKAGSPCDHFNMGSLLVQNNIKLPLKIPLIKLGFSRVNPKSAIPVGTSIILNRKGIPVLGKVTKALKTVIHHTTGLLDEDADINEQPGELSKSKFGDVYFALSDEKANRVILKKCFEKILEKKNTMKM